jgi:hypothetical protein
MAIIALSILLVCIVLCFAGILFWALVLQPRAEKSAAALTAADAWKLSGLQTFRSADLSLYQIAPAPSLIRSEFRIQDESGQTVGTYTATGKKSATLEYATIKANLYIQGAPLGGSIYSGKVGGSTNNSIVIRDDARLIAEAWRTRVFPAATYRCACGGETFEITRGGLWPTRLGTIAQGPIQIGAFRRPAASSRNLFIVLRNNLPDELKLCLCALSLLQ